MIKMNKLISFVKQFTKEEVKELNSAERIGRKYFYIKDELKQLKDKIDLEPYSAGLPLGELVNNRFVPSLALLEILARARYTDKMAFLNKKGETMFLYGRDVFEENIVKGRDKEGLVLVQNEKDENLGCGEIIIKRGKRILKSILDKGDYLRREKR